MSEGLIRWNTTDSAYRLDERTNTTKPQEEAEALCARTSSFVTICLHFTSRKRHQLPTVCYRTKAVSHVKKAVTMSYSEKQHADQRVNESQTGARLIVFENDSGGGSMHAVRIACSKHKHRFASQPARHHQKSSPENGRPPQKVSITAVNSWSWTRRRSPFNFIFTNRTRLMQVEIISVRNGGR